MSEMTASDVALLNGNGNNAAWMNNPFMYLVFLFLMRYWNNGSDSATQGALTRAELADGLNFQSVNTDLGNIRNSISDVSSVVQSVTSNLSDKMCSGFNSLNTNIMQSNFTTQNGICDINRNIDSVRYELAQNLGMITNTIHSEAEATRQALIDQQIQDLRDSRESVQRELQSAQLTLANAAQTQNILGSIGRYVPYAGCGSTCGCSGW